MPELALGPYRRLPPRSANANGGTPAGVQGAEPLAGGAMNPILRYCSYPLKPVPLSLP
jgi:hypothetical protein